MRHCVLFVSIVPTVNGIQFVALGDWGLAGSSFETTINSIHTECPDRDFVLLLGDKYPRGFDTVNDSDWDLFTNRVARGSSVPHHVVLGNHDYMSNPQAQLDFAKLDPRWDLPSKYYKRTYTDGETSICVVGIDTNIFDQVQAEWLTGQFSDPACDPENAWIVVMGHHPIWSGAMYSNTSNLVEKLLPILKEHRVHLYLSGHDHVHEVFYDGQLTTVVSGAVAVMRPPVTFAPNDYQIWGVSGKNVEGYVKVDALQTELNVQVISARSNQIFQQFSITKDGNRQSIFGHIKWDRHDSNRDAFIADGDTKDSASSLPMSIVLITILVSYGTLPL